MYFQIFQYRTYAWLRWELTTVTGVSSARICARFSARRILHDVNNHLPTSNGSKPTWNRTSLERDAWDAARMRRQVLLPSRNSSDDADSCSLSLRDSRHCWKLLIHINVRTSISPIIILPLVRKTTIDFVRRYTRTKVLHLDEQPTSWLLLINDWLYK